MRNRMSRMNAGSSGKKPLILIGVAAIAVVILFAMFFGGDQGANTEALTTAPVVRGTLEIDVLESGNVESSDAQTIKSEVEGMTTIISIVPEGTILTQEDVDNERVLVELDSSDLRDRETQQEIQVQSAKANLTEASESFAIQIKQNESNAKQGELTVKFARMDMEKYLGSEAAEAFLKDSISLDNLIDSPRLGGEALQKLRTLQDAINDASSELNLATDKYEWSKKLFEKGYVTRNELNSDELNSERRKVQLKKAQSDLYLYRRYEFPKQAEKLLSDYEEAKRDLERILARNRSELAQKEARLRSNEATYFRQKEQLDKIREQIDKCTIVATKPGLIVYAGSDQPWRTDRQISEGAQVRERQEIIKIPNTSSMVVKAGIHETVVARVKEGQPAVVNIEAIPGQEFPATVKKVGIVPDSQNRWMNPNLKVYSTDIEIQGNDKRLKPGMSAEVRIITGRLDDVLMVPIQAVERLGDRNVCFVMNSSEAEMTDVEVGEYNDEFIEVKSGLEEGQQVVLNASSLVEQEKMKAGGALFDQGPQDSGDQPVGKRMPEGVKSKPAAAGQRPEGESPSRPQRRERPDEVTQADAASRERPARPQQKRQ